MRMAQGSLGDFISGAVIVAIGAAACIMAYGYGLGSLRNIGPGALPSVVGLILVASGIGICIRSRATATPFPAIHWRPFLAVLGSVAAWALLARSIGFIGATIALVVIATFAQDSPRWKAALATAVLLAAGGSIVFLKLLGIQLPMVRGSLF